MAEMMRPWGRGLGGWGRGRGGPGGVGVGVVAGHPTWAAGLNLRSGTEPWFASSLAL